MTASQKTDRELCKYILSVQGQDYDDWLANIHRQYVQDNYQVLGDYVSARSGSGTLKYTKKGMSSNETP